MDSWIPRPAADEAPAPVLDAVAEVQRQIFATPDLRALARHLGFDVDVAERVRQVMSRLRATVRADVGDLTALQAAVATARSQADGGSLDLQAADRELLSRLAAAGHDRTAVLELLNQDPVDTQLPFIERIPFVRNGATFWRTPAEHSLIWKRPVDREAFEGALTELDEIFAAPQRAHREPLRLEVIEALARVRSDGRREKAYLPTALQLLQRKMDTYLTGGAAPSAPARFDRLRLFLRRLIDAEWELKGESTPDASVVTELASEYVATPWMHAPNVTHRLVAMLLDRPYVSASPWYRRGRLLRLLGLLRDEVTTGHYEGAEVVRRLQGLEAGGAFFSSLVYALLRGPTPSYKPRSTRSPG